LRLLALLTATAAVALSLAAPSTAAHRYPVPDDFFAQALCVHSGWHYQAAHGWKERRALARRFHRRPDYWSGRTAFYRTYDVSDGISGGSGEGSWTTVNGYGGGLQFLLSTWISAARLSRGAVPYLSSATEIAREPPAMQILAAYFIVRNDGGSWREWPWTSRACGLR
jgi:hypothetical protein